jgi:hypothetical protein
MIDMIDRVLWMVVVALAAWEFLGDGRGWRHWYVIVSRRRRRSQVVGAESNAPYAMPATRPRHR